MSFHRGWYEMAHYSEDLYFTVKGKFKLEVEGQRDYTKTLTPKEAKKWLKTRYPKWNWNSMVKSANRLLANKEEKAA